MASGPAVREAGEGPAVICLHCSASTGGQWRALMDRLSPRWRVLAPDLYGYGKDAPRERLPTFELDDELDWLQSVFERAGEAVHLVGHSYGGLIALRAALRWPERVKSIVLYEPATWSVAVQEDPTHAGAEEIRAVADATIDAIAVGEVERTAADFVRYWAGPGAWDAMPPERRQITTDGMPKVGAEFRAERRHGETGTRLLDYYGAVAAPVLYLTGTRTKASARRVGELLPQAFRNVTVVRVEGAGHMGPVTHADAVNGHIEAFLDGFPA